MSLNVSCASCTTTRLLPVIWTLNSGLPALDAQLPPATFALLMTPHGDCHWQPPGLAWPTATVTVLDRGEAGLGGLQGRRLSLSRHTRARRPARAGLCLQLPVPGWLVTTAPGVALSQTWPLSPAVLRVFHLRSLCSLLILSLF